MLQAHLRTMAFVQDILTIEEIISLQKDIRSSLTSRELQAKEIIRGTLAIQIIPGPCQSPHACDVAPVTGLSEKVADTRSVVESLPDKQVIYEKHAVPVPSGFPPKTCSIQPQATVRAKVSELEAQRQCVSERLRELEGSVVATQSAIKHVEEYVGELEEQAKEVEVAKIKQVGLHGILVAVIISAVHAPGSAGSELTHGPEPLLMCGRSQGSES
jgi:hypothetical protein